MSNFVQLQVTINLYKSGTMASAYVQVEQALNELMNIYGVEGWDIVGQVDLEEPSPELDSLIEAESTEETDETV
jgi:hypothetical protein